ncbi:hypothetical protein JL722_12648 [Aureococcus anophagefferens]|nr:hypothetical protein JL722_12648 [Aureococcus anophagefferens]
MEARAASALSKRTSLRGSRGGTSATDPGKIGGPRHVQRPTQRHGAVIFGMTEKSMASRAPAAAVTRGSVALVGALAESAGRAAAIGDPSAELTSRNDEPVQVAIRVYVERELLTMKVYEQLCARLGLCDPACFKRAPTPWAKGKCARRELVRFENWVTGPWDASKALKPNLRITTDSKARCYAKNALQFDRFKGFPWWSHNAWPSHDGDDGHCAGLARTATKAMAAF